MKLSQFIFSSSRKILSSFDDSTKAVSCDPMSKPQLRVIFFLFVDRPAIIVTQMRGSAIRCIYMNNILIDSFDSHFIPRATSLFGSYIFASLISI